MKKLAPLCLVSLLAASCEVTIAIEVEPSLQTKQRFAVVRQPREFEPVSNSIRDALSDFGVQAIVVGSLSEVPSDCDAVASYVDRWMWDLSMYLLELSVTIRDSKTQEIIGAGRLYRTSLVRRSHQRMAQQLIHAMLSKYSRGTR
jgi:hypothetical protein